MATQKHVTLIDRHQKGANNPRGKNLGTPGAADRQRAILRAALDLLETASEPFTTIDWTPDCRLRRSP
jgi:hypothetical protein